MRSVSSQEVACAVERVIPRLACEMQEDIADRLRIACDFETAPLGRSVLEQLRRNEEIARCDHVPLCQDTGVVWVCLEAGSDVCVPGDVFSGVDAAVARAYEKACLRMSLVHDAVFDRSNTQDNTPAFCEVCLSQKPGARLHIMLKGAGSDNASRVTMLTPSAGRTGIIDEVVACVREKGANACPPLVIGIGIGSTFDAVAHLAKMALMRPLDEQTEDPSIAAFEEELLRAVQATDVGPGGLGGKATALGVRIVTAPCHIAALPLAVNMGCSALRRMTVQLELGCGDV